MENKFKSLESVIREMSIDRNTKAREKVVNVGRPDKPALAKQGEIKTKIIDEDHHVHVDDGRNYGSRPHDKDAEHVKAGLEKHGGEFVGHTDKGVSFKFKTPVAAANFRKHVSAAPHKTMFADEPSYYNESKELIDEKKKVEKEDIMFGKGPPDNMSSPSNSQAPVTPTSNATPSMPNVWNNTPSMFQPKMPKITEAKDKNFDDVEVTDKKNSPSPSSKKTKPTDSEDHDLDDAKKVNGGTTDVELNPKTDDKVNSETDEDDSAKKGRKKANKEIGQKGAPIKEELIFEGYHVKDHATFGKVLAKDGNTHMVDYDTADKIADKHKGASVIKTLDRKKYIIKMPEHMKHGQQVEVEGY